MPLRETSLEAFRSLRSSGVINELHEDILKYILGYSDMVCRHDLEMFFSDTTQTYGPRLAELERKGLVYRAGTKLSPRTGRKVQGWRVVKEFDTEKAHKNRPRTSEQKLRQLVSDLTEFRCGWFFQLGVEGIAELDALLEKVKQ